MGWCVPAGPSGRPCNSSYRNRDSIDYKQELGNAIGFNFARIVHDGLLMLFPSYYLLAMLWVLEECVLFAVCHGKVSEGLDFVDHAGRAVVIIVMPFASRNDPKIRLKRVLDEQLHLQGEACKVFKFKFSVTNITLDTDSYQDHTNGSELHTMKSLSSLLDVRRGKDLRQLEEVLPAN
ncbi:hypothetical protein GH714_022470 [Hevea brasiliensis]|uniref:ATP-dependent helicase C-terminal domain-containing protein n=1 Tax=Hevea brasiliensis TaxID=3981 RepID=A0A6A6LMJ7_HEVBR|nr:hypothetical protein GH714_022470 [Hevea brasiliensis]